LESSCLTFFRIESNGVAERAGLRQGYIAYIESGKKTGSAASLRAIAAALGVPLDAIVG
jgi:transcriptional regulator with XRE-family HTH domain